MCGIIGIVSKNLFSSEDLLRALKRLEYRGYDSFGYATNSGILEKDIGEIRLLSSNECTTAIGHTRWATHGGVTKLNAHPHADCKNEIFIVHNGIIENYLELKEKLRGHVFRSETDSEVIAHYLEEKLKTKPMREAIIDFINEAEGTFAVVVLQKSGQQLYAFKRDSPLVLGLAGDANIFASDIYAFSDKTNKAVFFEDDEFAEVSDSSYAFYNKSGNMLDKKIYEFEWKEEESEMKFDHYMLKEIYEQPAVAERLINSLRTVQADKLENLVSLIKNSRRIIFIAVGTSYHASLLGVYFLHKAGVEAQTIIASEFKDYANVDENTLVIAITQSGETMDLIDAVKHAKRKGAKIASLVNVPYSTVQRLSDLSLQIEAGQEICVAATKSFMNQVILLLSLAREFGYDVNPEKISEVMRSVFGKEEKIKSIARSLSASKDLYIIGRGLSYPVSREIALKLKEISYVHAEGMMGGELKHGTLALIEEGTPVIALINGNPHIISNAMEVKARGGRIIAVTNQKNLSVAKDLIEIDADNDAAFAIAAIIAGQLLTYYIAKEKDLPIDKPRNLAKSVTVK
ncbi:MAG: glutamine--fructose-6-phosphate transaminase (isomerizing) [Candidatus Aenigmarchaeota archaeon]|nr:glutamine--fructose-6-phosphate transaminase (isomerizing) [Candidatus Aenigmarchaeota archaeon]